MLIVSTFYKLWKRLVVGLGTVGVCGRTQGVRLMSQRMSEDRGTGFG